MKKLKRALIKEELVKLTNEVNEAIVLNQFIYWSERVKDSDSFLKEEIERSKRYNDGSVMSPEEAKSTLLNGWIYKTAEEMLDETMLTISRQTMDRVLKNLVDKKFVNRRRNPKYKWDKTWQYRVDLQFINQKLIELGYSLEGYSLPNSYFEQSEVQNEQSKVQYGHTKAQYEQSKVQYEQSNAQDEQAIPEITTKTTTKITTENNNVVSEDISIYKIIIDYLNDKTKKRYKYDSKSNQKYINGRISEGYDFDDFKQVIDIKVEEWIGTKMEQYLRPSTLFNSEKFEAYLNQGARIKKEKEEDSSVEYDYGF
ncbi:conserved phage C-terminal domain-containing protein [Savagea sp. SN6]|uniref:Conserved phage C-terminal domain-containing protein n=1 Tax=Savagea serpentis TaxID=2785297 RepID=A0A8J7KHK7_9BACL|nr:conserved phage C-terminal domain-containing protein [Savagea serpentis]MBF4501193.1 conserved phage C-terminal domain-containing protein [Savagea serpentis]